MAKLSVIYLSLQIIKTLMVFKMLTLYIFLFKNDILTHSVSSKVLKYLKYFFIRSIYNDLYYYFVRITMEWIVLFIQKGSKIFLRVSHFIEIKVKYFQITYYFKRSKSSSFSKYNLTLLRKCVYTSMTAFCVWSLRPLGLPLSSRRLFLGVSYTQIFFSSFLEKNKYGDI